MEFREIHFKPYRIIYQIIDKRVFVHCVLDGRRDLQELLERRMLR
jgi:toxin ParE1/3/4